MYCVRIISVYEAYIYCANIKCRKARVINNNPHRANERTGRIAPQCQSVRIYLSTSVLFWIRSWIYRRKYLLTSSFPLETHTEILVFVLLELFCLGFYCCCGGIVVCLWFFVVFLFVCCGLLLFVWFLVWGFLCLVLFCFFLCRFYIFFSYNEE